MGVFGLWLSGFGLWVLDWKVDDDEKGGRGDPAFIIGLFLGIRRLLSLSFLLQFVECYAHL